MKRERRAVGTRSFFFCFFSIFPPGMYLLRFSSMVQQVKESAYDAGDEEGMSSIPGLGRSPGGENGNTLTGKSHGQRSLVGYSLWSHKESDMTEHSMSSINPVI